MPIINSTYQPSKIWQNPHFSTIYPSVFRQVKGVEYTRERMELSDGDFLDLDWSFAENTVFNQAAILKVDTLFKKNNRLAIFTHGFLGNSTRPYLLGGVKSFNSVGYDALAWNHRGLGGENNRFERITTHGSSDELEEVLNHVLSKNQYNEITLVGYSKGGNISMKYAGEKGENIPAEIKNIVAISTPTDLQGSVDAMGKDGFYTNRFHKKLMKFLKNRQQLIGNEAFASFKKFQYIDDYTDFYIAPLHGFKDAKDYYDQCSAMHVVDKIRVPTLILNAQNDPVLSESCAMKEVAEKSDYIFSETPKFGGHCGFYEANKDGIYWVDKRAVEFVNTVVMRNKSVPPI
ncbi:MAG: alpha/beta fold hydrolase [Arcicella sp.]|nr:alpha/beta fold hydrolase [Arcicella sp.]